MARRKSILSILVGGSKKRAPSRRKPKTIMGTLLEGQRRTEKSNVPGSKRKYKSSW